MLKNNISLFSVPRHDVTVAQSEAVKHASSLSTLGRKQQAKGI